MAYYIISFDPGPVEQFQKGISFLEDALWVEDQENLAQLLTLPEVDSFFIVQFSHDHEATDDLVLTIRQKKPSAKIIYLVEVGKAPDLKSHQKTPVGGDAYVPFHISEGQFWNLIDALKAPELNPRGNRLESGGFNLSAHSGLDELKNHPKNIELEKTFAAVFEPHRKKPSWQSAESLNVNEVQADEEADIPDLPDELVLGDDMSDKDQELSLDDLGDLEISDDNEVELQDLEEDGLDLSLGEDLDLDLSSSGDFANTSLEDSGMDLDLDEGFSLDDDSDDGAISLEATDDSDDLEISEADNSDLDFSLDDIREEVAAENALDLGDELSLSDDDMATLDFGSAEEDDDVLSLDDGDDLELSGDIDLSDDAKEKLKEIDAIMDLDASQVGITLDLGPQDELDEDDLGFSLDAETENEAELEGDRDLETSLVSDDLNLESINFSSEEEAEPVTPVANIKRTKVAKESYDGSIGKDLKEISGAYSGEMDRVQATISNLRSDREELLAKIQKLEEDKMLQSRQMLTMRAELDEKKIELTIIRKKLNEEISELKDRLKLFEEKKLILEERNRILTQELDKTSQKNKIDVRKVQMRERELEQKLELLKADSETQIRHRDLKILELKRKLDAMEFDVESISVQEQRSVESRFELEDKLDKAIKTLRKAITVLEDETDKGGALEALKKNIDM